MMKATLSTLAIAVFLALPGALSRAAELTAQQKKAQDLVRRLGSESYLEREQASVELRNLGLAARGALEEGLADADLEVRHRCQDILPAVLEIDLKNRIAAFVADKDGKDDVDVLGWRRFRKVAGSGPAARELFCEMLHGDCLALLTESSDHPDRQAEILEHYVRRLQQRMFLPFGQRNTGQFSRAELAAALFLGGLDPTGTAQKQGPSTLCNLLYQQAARSALSEGPSAPVVKALLLRWMENQHNEVVLMQMGQVIQVLNLKEGQTLLVDAIKGKKVRGFMLAHVAVSLGRVGGKEHVAVLEALLGDETPLGRVQFNRLAGDAQVRDVALAMVVHLTGQSHKDYGFVFVANQPGLLWSPNYLGFSTAQQREAAHKKWKNWSLAQKK